MTGSIHKGCPYIRGDGDQAKVDRCGQEEGVVSQMWMSSWNYSYHICEFYSDDLAVCLYIEFPLCLYSIENVWNECNDIISKIVFMRMFFMSFSNRMISFFYTSVWIVHKLQLFQIMPVLYPHKQGEGVSQMWAGLDRGRGVLKFPKFVRKSFMDDPLDS